MKKITLSLAFASLLASSAIASDNYRIFLGAYSGPTEEFVRDVTPKLKDVAGIGEVIAEKRGSKTYVFVDVNEPGATAARNLLPTVREKSGIADAYVLMVKDKEDLKKEEAMKPSIVITDNNKPAHIPEKTVQVEKKKELNLSLPVAEPAAEKKAEKKPELLLKPKKTLEPSFKTVKIEKAKELSEIIGESKKEQKLVKKVEAPKKVEKKVEKAVEEVSPITPRPKEMIQKTNDGLKGSGYNFYQIKKHPEKNTTEEVKDFDALLKARVKATETQK